MVVVIVMDGQGRGLAGWLAVLSPVLLLIML